jgi:hypothetical protein
MVILQQLFALAILAKECECLLLYWDRATSASAIAGSYFAKYSFQIIHQII